MKIIFCTSNGIGSRMIRSITWSVGGTAADAVIPVRTGDVVTVTYSAAKPTMYQLSN